MKPLGALALLLIMLMGWSAPTGALADIPWVTMHVGSFPATPEAAAQQSLTLGFSDAEANQLQYELSLYLQDPNSSTACQAATATDGTRYSAMGMAGYQVAHNIVKKHGVDRPVVQCTIGGQTVHWFNQPIIGCNNLGLVAVAVSKPLLPKPPLEAKVETFASPALTIVTPGLVVPGCDPLYLPGTTVVISGGNTAMWSSN